MSAVITYILVASAQIPVFLLLYTLLIGMRDDERETSGWGRWWLFTLVPLLCLPPLVFSGMHLYFNLSEFSTSLILTVIIVTIACLLSIIPSYYYCIYRRRENNIPTSPEVLTMIVFHAIAVIIATWCICL